MGRRRHSILRAAALAAGLLLGLGLALPLPDVRAACPPLSEGLLQCKLYKAWLPSAVTLVLAPLTLLALTELVLRGLPRPRARRDFAAETTPDWAGDPVLLAASWGITYEPVAGARDQQDLAVVTAFETLVAKKREERAGGNASLVRPLVHEHTGTHADRWAAPRHPRDDRDGDPERSGPYHRDGGPEQSGPYDRDGGPERSGPYHRDADPEHPEPARAVAAARRPALQRLP